jgi:exonuclease VII large subunit
MARGYAIVYRKDTDAIVTNTAQAQPGDRLRIRVSDGEFESTVSTTG